ncbi:cytochrome b [Arhodomonas sp. SL1]|uniref:cytochrome b n=1 Tax=Arhodomonas sp. SL1 TaxID=3425691 RepID=UPI003F88298D
MQLMDSQADYGSLTRTLHWLTAALIAAMLLLGWFMEELPESMEETAVGLHISLGVSVLALGVLRLAWRLANRRTPAHDTGLLGAVAVAVQWALVTALIVLPLSGWLLVSSGGHSVEFFGLFTLPPLTGASESLHELGEEAHELLAWVLVGLLVVHIVGALKHHLLDGDDTLRRMLRATARPSQ